MAPILSNNQISRPYSGGAIQGPNTAKTLMPGKYARKSPVFGFKPRFFTLKPLNLDPKKWLVSAVFSDDRV